MVDSQMLSTRPNTKLPLLPIAQHQCRPPAPSATTRHQLNFVPPAPAALFQSFQSFEFYTFFISMNDLIIIGESMATSGATSGARGALCTFEHTYFMTK